MSGLGPGFAFQEMGMDEHIPGSSDGPQHHRTYQALNLVEPGRYSKFRTNSSHLQLNDGGVPGGIEI